MPTTRPHPRPPRPGLVRRPAGAFGWLGAHLLHEGWLARVGPDAAAVLVLLALAADRHGASYFGRARMAESLGLDVPRVDSALARLRGTGLVVHRPWRQGCADGVWQLLPVPRRGVPANQPEPRVRERPSGNAPMHVAAILAQLGFATNRQDLAEPISR